jgi:hypothetical protein
MSFFINKEYIQNINKDDIKPHALLSLRATYSISLLTASNAKPMLSQGHDSIRTARGAALRCTGPRAGDQFWHGYPCHNGTRVGGTGTRARDYVRSNAHQEPLKSPTQLIPSYSFNNNMEFPDDCLPPEAEYESREDLITAANGWAASRGYAFTIGRSTTSRTTIPKITLTLVCDRKCETSGRRQEADSINIRVSNTTSRRTACEFSILAKQSADLQTWYIRHRPNAQHAIHNHKPSFAAVAHPTHRALALSAQDQITIGKLVDAGVGPKEIRTYIQQNSNNLTTQADVYNHIAAHKREIREGQSSIYALINQLDSEGFWSRMQFDS